MILNLIRRILCDNKRHSTRKINKTSVPYAILGILIVAVSLSGCEQPPVDINSLAKTHKPTKYITYLEQGQQAAGVLVKFTSNTGARSRSRALQAAGLNQAGEFSLVPGLTASTVIAGLDINQTLDNLRNTPGVAYAEPDYILSIAAIPDDTDFTKQWGLSNPNNADVSATKAWDITKGDKSIIIAVIDSGVDYTHPDLQGQIWTNPGEIANNGRDDDGNGFTDDVRGWDFSDNTNDPMDLNSHGTHVAGVIGARTNNGRGVAGLNWNVQIMPLKFMNDRGLGSTSAAIRAIDYAVSNGAVISNNSWGGGPFSQALFDAIQVANTKNHLFVAAAGNDSVNTDSGSHYPSAYNLPNIISVAASDINDQLASFSNFGVRTVDLAAPGAQILSTVRNGGYQSFSGTSMAAPFVSGVAGLVLSQNNTLSVAELKAAILDNVDPVSAFSRNTVTGGRLNALKAVSGVASTAPTTPVAPVLITPPATSSMQTGDSLQLIATGGDNNYNWSSNNANIVSVNVATGLITARAAGTARINATDGTGLVSPPTNFTVSVVATTLSINPTSITQMALSDTISLSVTGGVSPYSWGSSNAAVANVKVNSNLSGNATLTANQSGAFRINVSDANGASADTAIITVTNQALAIGISKNALNINEKLQLSASGGTSPYTWTSSKPAVISINSGGLITGLAEGTSNISISDITGTTTSINIQVINSIAGQLTLSTSTSATVFPVNSRALVKAAGSTSTINWTSSDATVASIDNRGILTTNANGTTEIRATDNQGNTGTLKMETRTITIDAAILTIGAGDTLQLTATGGQAPYEWSTSNATIATIDSNGLLISIIGKFGAILVKATDADQISKSLIISINDATALRSPKAQ